MRALACLAASALLACATHPAQTAGRPGVAPRSLDFGPVVIGEASTLTVVVTQLDPAPHPLVVDPASIPAGVSVTVDPGELQPGATRTMTVTFAPMSPGPLTGALVVQAGGQTGIPLSGTAVELNLEIDPPDRLDFGAVPIRVPRSLPISIRNPSTIPQTFYLSTSDPAFQVDPLQQMLGPGESATVPVSFTPAWRGASQAELQFARYPVGSPVLTLPLQGTGQLEAFDVAPAALDFGETFPGQKSCQDVTLRNRGDAPIHFASVDADDAFRTSGAFELKTGSLLDPATTLEAGGFAVLTMCFNPTALGKAYSGTLTFRTTSGVSASLLVQGRGGGFEIVCTPDPVRLVATPSSPIWQEVTCQNLGESQDIAITSLTVSDVQTLYLDTSAYGDPRGFNLGQSEYRFSVLFRPSVPGSYNIFLTLAYARPDEPEAHRVQIPINGTAVDAQPCSLDVRPLKVDFGSVAAGTSSRRELRLTNTDPDAACVVWGFSQLDDPLQQLTISGAPVDMATIEPGGTLALGVSYEPGSEYDQQTLSFRRITVAGADPMVRIPIIGFLQTSNLVVNPDPIDFGTVSSGMAHALQVTVTNPGSTTVSVGLTMASDFPSAFSISGLLPDAYNDLEAGASRTFSINLVSGDPGLYYSDLWLYVRGAAANQVPVQAEVTP